jgi:hypothetical protein
MGTLRSVEEILGLVRSLVNLEDETSRHRLRWDSASESVWSEIIAKYPELKGLVSLNKVLPDGIKRLLASDPDPKIRHDIAMKRALPLDLLVLLAEDSDETVRARIAWNKRTPVDLLLKLTHDSSSIVSKAAQDRPLDEKRSDDQAH